jgi:hypothetical protein
MSLRDLEFGPEGVAIPRPSAAPPAVEPSDHLADARALLRSDRMVACTDTVLPDTAEQLRWFPLPHEAVPA